MGTATTAPATSGPATKKRDRTGVFVRLSETDVERVRYWAEKRGYPSVGEYVSDAVAAQIRRENHDYDLPAAEIARLNELIDQIRALSTNQANLERVIIQGFESLLSLTRGDSYLLDDDEDGEL